MKKIVYLRVGRQAYKITVDAKNNDDAEYLAKGRVMNMIIVDKVEDVPVADIDQDVFDFLKSIING